MYISPIMQKQASCVVEEGHSGIEAGLVWCETGTSPKWEDSVT